MSVSVFDLFKIGIGPSSSHTVGPMKAANSFACRLQENGLLEKTVRIRVCLHGSLAHTGRGHGTDKAVMLGLQGELPDSINPDSIDSALQLIRSEKHLNVLGLHPIVFEEKDDLVFRKRELLPHHSNGMRFDALDAAGELLEHREYYSVGGGFVVNQDEVAQERIVLDSTVLPYPYENADQLLGLCEAHGLRIAQIMLANEQQWRPEAEIRAGLLQIHAAMKACMERGYRQKGVLPGGLKVVRRAPSLYEELNSQAGGPDPLATLDWVNLYALAVNEENAAGGQVVTAPTNGAAGTMPAVLRYYLDHVPGASESHIEDFLLTAAWQSPVNSWRAPLSAPWWRRWGAAWRRGAASPTPWAATPATSRTSTAAWSAPGRRAERWTRSF